MLQDQVNKEKVDHELLKVKIESLYTTLTTDCPKDLKSHEMIDHIAQVRSAYFHHPEFWHLTS